jgi:uncharacterized membrane protein
MDQRYVYGVTIGAVGLLLTAVQILHGIAQFQVPIAIVVDVGPFVAMSLSLTYVGYWMTQTEAYKPDLPRVMLWAVGGTVAFAAVAALLLFSQRVTSGAIPRSTFIAIDLITAGSVSGIVVGLYDAESRQRLRELEAERDRVETFANTAADMNNYGRAIAQADTVEGVGAFCLEAAATLLGSRETAIVEVKDETIHFVGNTIAGIENGALEPLISATVDQQPQSVAVRAESLPDGLGDDGRAVTVHVTKHGDKSVVLLALTRDPTSIAEEDKQLLELLVSHAALTIDEIYRDKTTKTGGGEIAQ